jgi:glutathione S-transferase
MQPTRLTTFVVSHFSEKARWALDFEGVGYEERRLLPGPHLLVTRRLAPKGCVPILEHAGQVIQGSSLILDYIESELGRRLLAPSAGDSERARELEALADRAFGLGVQRISYFYLLDREKQSVIELWSQQGPWWARTFYALAYPVVAKETRRMYGVTAEAVSEAKALFRSAIGEFDAALARKPYLGGEQPNRVDITVAALLAPLCRPPQHVVHWPELPEALAAFASEFAHGRTWQHVSKMYRLQRKR